LLSFFPKPKNNMPLPAPIAPLQNPKSHCAAFSQTWLALSLIQGNPVTKVALLQKDGSLMGTVQNTAGQASVTSLDENGMSITSTSIHNNVGWATPLQALFNASNGFYYLTIKYGPGGASRHAMAAHVNNGSIHYLEPEIGLYQLTNANVQDLAAWYASRIGQATVFEFKIYKVKIKP
jgi:hypothetical protein